MSVSGAVVEYLSQPFRSVWSFLQSLNVVLDYNYWLVSGVVSRVYAGGVCVARWLRVLGAAALQIGAALLDVLAQVYQFLVTVCRALGSVLDVTVDTAAVFLAWINGVSVSALEKVRTAWEWGGDYVTYIGEGAANIGGHAKQAAECVWAWITAGLASIASTLSLTAYNGALHVWNGASYAATCLQEWTVEAGYSLWKFAVYASYVIGGTFYNIYLWCVDWIVSGVGFLRVHVNVCCLVVAAIYQSIPIYLHILFVISGLIYYFLDELGAYYRGSHMARRVSTVGRYLRKLCGHLLRFAYINIYVAIFRDRGGGQLALSAAGEEDADIITVSDTSSESSDDGVDMEIIDDSSDDDSVITVATRLSDATTVADGPATRRSFQTEEDETLELDSESVPGDAPSLALRERLKAERRRRLCVVCLQNERRAMLAPCNHVCLCNGCAHQWTLGRTRTCRVCPVCRVRVEQVHRVYM